VPGAALEFARKGVERPTGAIGPAAVLALTRKNRWEPKLSDPKQGAPEAAGASFFLTNEAARGALPVPPLSLEVINALAEIEPNNGIARTVTLRYAICTRVRFSDSFKPAFALRNVIITAFSFFYWTPPAPFRLQTVPLLARATASPEQQM